MILSYHRRYVIPYILSIEIFMFLYEFNQDWTRTAKIILREPCLLMEFPTSAHPLETNISAALNGFLHLCRKHVDAVKINVKMKKDSVKSVIISQFISSEIFQSLCSIPLNSTL